MNFEASYYMFGTFFFVMAFVLLIILTILAIITFKNVQKVQTAAIEALEEKKSLADILPLIAMTLFEAKGWVKKFKR